MVIYEEIVERLNEYASMQVIDEYTKVTIIDMSKKVLEHLAKKYSNVVEEDVAEGDVEKYWLNN